MPLEILRKPCDIVVLVVFSSKLVRIGVGVLIGNVVFVFVVVVGDVVGSVVAT